MDTKIISIAMIYLVFGSIAHANADEEFMKKHGSFNESFIKAMAKNRSHQGDKNAKFTEVKGEEEFENALDSGAIGSSLKEGNGVTQQYVYTSIEDVNVNDKDLNSIEGDTLHLGSKVGENGGVTQVVNIVNSNIETEKNINAGITTDSDSLSGVTSITTIEGSTLSGGN